MNNVHHPTHYTQRKHECIEFTQHMNFILGNAFKCVWRYQEKGGIEDLDKALWYLMLQKEKQISISAYVKAGKKHILYKLKQCEFTPVHEAALEEVVNSAFCKNMNRRMRHLDVAIIWINHLKATL